jgi:hypothetical protein
MAEDLGFKVPLVDIPDDQMGQTYSAASLQAFLREKGCSGGSIEEIYKAFFKGANGRAHDGGPGIDVEVWRLSPKEGVPADSYIYRVKPLNEKDADRFEDMAERFEKWSLPASMSQDENLNCQKINDTQSNPKDFPMTQKKNLGAPKMSV